MYFYDPIDYRLRLLRFARKNRTGYFSTETINTIFLTFIFCLIFIRRMELRFILNQHLFCEAGFTGRSNLSDRKAKYIEI